MQIARVEQNSSVSRVLTFSGLQWRDPHFEFSTEAILVQLQALKRHSPKPAIPHSICLAIKDDLKGLTATSLKAQQETYCFSHPRQNHQYNPKPQIRFPIKLDAEGDCEDMQELQHISTTTLAVWRGSSKRNQTENT